MADFETKLRWLSERGNPVGAEELIERIEAEMAGDPLVVVAKRREGTIMSKTRQSPNISRLGRYKGPAWGLAALVVILAVAGLYYAFSGDTDQVADNPSPPTTVAPDVETMTDLEVIEAGVAALYSGNADRAVELFELPAPDDEGVRSWSAFQAAVDGRLTLDCVEGNTRGIFSCLMLYHNVWTDAIGWVDSPGDATTVVVSNGVITTFDMPVHSFIHRGVEEFLIEEGALFLSAAELDLVSNCVLCSMNAEVAKLAVEYLDEWAAWAATNLELPVTDIDNPTRLPEFGQGPIGPLDPGAYIADADGDPATTAAATFLVESSGWMGSNEGVFRQNLNEVLLHVHQVDGPYAAAPSCDPTGDNPMPAGSTAADLAERFAADGFTVRQAPAPVRAFGYDGHHVVIEVPEGCDDAQGWQRGIFLHPGDVMEAWIFDMDGHMLMIEAMWRIGSPEEELAELKAVIDTLVLTP